MKTTVVLVRHGETHENREHTLQGLDPTRGRLTERGVAQAAAVGRALAGHDFDRIYCSPLARAVATLGRILEGRGARPMVQLHFDDDLREAAMGELHGAPQARWLEGARAHGDPLTYRAPGGESMADLQKRAGTWFDRAVARHPGERILVVAHGGIVKGVLTWVTGAPMVMGWAGLGTRPGSRNACINRVVVDDGRLVEATADDTRHLEGLLDAPSAGEVFRDGAWRVIGAG